MTAYSMLIEEAGPANLAAYSGKQDREWIFLPIASSKYALCLEASPFGSDMVKRLLRCGAAQCMRCYSNPRDHFGYTEGSSSLPQASLADG